MAGKVGKVEPIARLGDLNVTYGFSVEDRTGTQAATSHICDSRPHRRSARCRLARRP